MQIVHEVTYNLQFITTYIVDTRLWHCFTTTNYVP